MKWSTKSEKRSQSISLNILVPLDVSTNLQGQPTFSRASHTPYGHPVSKKKTHFSILYDPSSQQFWQDGRTQILITLWTALLSAHLPHHAARAYTAQSDQETRMLPVPHQKEAQLLLFLSQEVSGGSLLWLRCGQFFTVPVLEAWSLAWCFWGMMWNLSQVRSPGKGGGGGGGVR